MLVYMWDAQEKQIETVPAVMVNGTDIFRITGGPIQILAIGALCTTANDATASTLQYRADGTDGSATTITGASASLANKAAGTIVLAIPGTLATAPAVYDNGVGVGTASVPIIVPAGILEIVIGTGSTTGKWKHFLRWRPMVTGAQVNAV